MYIEVCFQHLSRRQCYVLSFSSVNEMNFTVFKCLTVLTVEIGQFCHNVFTFLDIAVLVLQE